VFHNKPKQGYVKHQTIISWNLHHGMARNGSELLKMKKNTEIMSRLAYTSTSLLYPVSDRAGVIIVSDMCIGQPIVEP
jgi:hypothetical protein